MSQGNTERSVHGVHAFQSLDIITRFPFPCLFSNCQGKLVCVDTDWISFLFQRALSTHLVDSFYNTDKLRHVAVIIQVVTTRRIKELLDTGSFQFKHWDHHGLSTGNKTV